MTRDERADLLAEIAAQLVGRVRDDSPEDVGRWLHNRMLDEGEDFVALALFLAAAVPDDRSWRELTAWVRSPQSRRVLRPHGTAAALRRHQYHREPSCVPCKAYDAARKRGCAQPVDEEVAA